MTTKQIVDISTYSNIQYFTSYDEEKDTQQNIFQYEIGFK